MKSYTDVIKLEGRRALSNGFGGSGSEPDYRRVDLIAEIFEKSAETVREDIIKHRDSRETYKKVAGHDRGY